MSNPFYTASGNPGTGASGLSALMRTEFLAIQAAFDDMPRITTQGNYDTIFVQVGDFTFNLPAGAGTLALTADVATEATARAAAVTAEATTRAAADTAEATTRAAADTTNATAISTETARATAAEGVLTTGIGTEATTRAAFDSSLSALVETAQLKIDANCYILLDTGNPLINLDGNDFIIYDRTANKLTLFIGGVAVFSVNSSGNAIFKGTVTQNGTP